MPQSIQLTNRFRSKGVQKSYAAFVKAKQLRIMNTIESQIVREEQVIVWNNICQRAQHKKKHKSLIPYHAAPVTQKAGDGTLYVKSDLVHQGWEQVTHLTVRRLCSLEFPS